MYFSTCQHCGERFYGYTPSNAVMKRDNHKPGQSKRCLDQQQRNQQAKESQHGDEAPIS